MRNAKKIGGTHEINVKKEKKWGKKLRDRNSLKNRDFRLEFSMTLEFGPGFSVILEFSSHSIRRVIKRKRMWFFSLVNNRSWASNTMPINK